MKTYIDLIIEKEKEIAISKMTPKVLNLKINNCSRAKLPILMLSKSNLVE